MNRLLWTWLSCLFLLVMSVAPVYAAEYVVVIEDGKSPDELAVEAQILKTTGDARLGTVIKSVELEQELATWEQSGVRLTKKLAETEGHDIWLVEDSGASDYETLPYVTSRTPNMRVKAAGVNDEFSGSQWSLSLIEADHAWTSSTGSRTVRVAIIDSGIEQGHEDIAASRIVDEYDFVDNDSIAEDDYGHGTSVAGVLMATSNNHIGMAGLDQQASIMDYRILDGTGGGSLDDLIAAMQRAKLQGADIVNLSVELDARCDAPILQSLQLMINDLTNAGILVVVAAGNGGADAAAVSPASCNNVITVGAVNRDSGMAWYSNRGSVVDIWAPGGTGSGVDSAILTTGTGNRYVTKTGTSFAAPHVSATLSLMKAANPTWTDDELRQALLRGAKTVDGRKVLNAGTAVTGSDRRPTPTASPTPLPTATVTPTPTNTPMPSPTTEPEPSPTPTPEEKTVISWLRETLLGTAGDNLDMKRRLSEVYIDSGVGVSSIASRR